MEITSREYKRAVVIRVTGRVDASVARQFEDTLDIHIKAGHTNLVLEMDTTDYISSAGVRAMITAHKALKPRGGAVIIAQPSERVREVLHMAGMEAIFPIHSDTVAAIGSI